MLALKIKVHEDFDNKTSTFINVQYFVLELEHSLASISKWESEFEKPFLAEGDKSSEEVVAYIRCMILNPDYPVDILNKVTKEQFEQINEYISAKRSATTFFEPKTANQKPTPKTVITSELIYYWMTSYQIPWEAQYWHLQRLFTLIKVFNVKNDKPKPQDRKTLLEQRRALNEQRKKEMGTRG